MPPSTHLRLQGALVLVLAIGSGSALPVDAQTPSLSVDDVKVAEGQSSTRSATFTLTLSGAPSSCVVTPTETFTTTDQPYYTSTSSGQGLYTPWGYDKATNAARKYPLVLSSSKSFFDSGDTGQRYPFFFMSFSDSTESGGASLATLIPSLEAQFRVDTNRIYLAGFSVNGSGSYKVARGYYDANGGLLAGILRMAGQSQTELPDGVVAKTSIWYHLGLSDTALRIQIAQEAYAFIKNHPSNASAVETSATDSIGGFARTTRTLTKDDIGIMKLSEYTAMGHQWPPADPKLFDWLFHQSLACR
jgi:hypothetical protein